MVKKEKRVNDAIKAISEIKIDVDSEWIPLDDIQIDPDFQPRTSPLWDDKHPKEVMMKSMKKDGNLAPLIVNVTGKLEDKNVEATLISGHRRLEIMKELGEKHAYCSLRKNMTKEEIFCMQIMEDSSKKEFNTEERKRSWKRYYLIRHKDVCKCDSFNRQCNYSVAHWAEEMGIHKRTAQNYIKLADERVSSSKPASDIEASQTEETPVIEEIGVSDKVDDERVPSLDLPPEVEVPQTKEIPVVEEIKVSEKEIGKEDKGKYRLNLRVSRETKIAVLKMGKLKGKGMNNAIEDIVQMRKCPHCKMELD